jgi:fibronectin-binding autotransporter adhesin
MNKLRKDERGYFLVSVVVMILFLTVVGLALASLSTTQYQHVKRQMFEQNAQLVAEAGIERSVHRLNSDDAFAGYTSTQLFYDNTTQGKATFTSTITDNTDGNSKTIVSTGIVYKAGESEPFLTRKIRATVVGTSSTGYSVHTGPGGLILSGSANITNSQVYVSGTITMSGASKIGTVNNPVNVDVANNACPTGTNPGPTYPQVCAGTQPISLAHSTNIFGTVCATGQTSTGPNNNIQGGTTGEGLKSGCTAPVYPQPTYDRAAHLAAVTTTASGNSNSYVCNNWPFNRNWPGHLKLTGNVSIGGSCDITINGDVHITGNLDIGGAAKIRVADSLGANRPTIMVDGTITVGGSASMIANASGTGIQFISYRNSTGNPDATVTGTNLKTSQSLQAISVSGAVNLPGMIFNAYWAKVTLSGSGNVGAAAGQTVDLSGAGTVVFGTTLSSGSKTWTITSYQPIN